MRSESANDQGLIARANKGDADTFDSLVRKYQKLVYILCHRLTGSHQTADDLSQETFIKALLQESPPEALQRAEMEKKFRDAFRRLPEDQKTIFALRTLENMSYMEIAQALAIPAGTVM